MRAAIEALAQAELDEEMTAPKSSARTMLMSSVSPVPVQWLWRPRIALGKLTIIAGDPGLGKSMLTASLMAHVSTGRNWPDGASCPTGSVVLVSGEDDPGDTIRPRLDMAGASAGRVHYLQSIRDHDGERGFTLADVVPIASLLDSIGDCKLIVIDPVSAYLAGTDSHKNSDIRALLTPLAQMAAAYGVAIVAVSHLNKSQAGNALSRVTGSLAFVAAARAAYVVARCPDDPARRLVLPIKNNLGNDLTGMAYRIASQNDVPYIVWEKDPVTISADEALAPMQDAPRSARDDAAEFLTQLLSRDPVSVDQVKAEGKAAGFSWATLRRAKEEIGAKSKKAGFDTAGWCWYLPLSKQLNTKVLNPINTQLSTFEDSEHLQGFPAIEEVEGAQGAHVLGLGTFEKDEHLPDEEDL